MGMFDTIECKYKLPDWPEGVEVSDSFQTQGLDNVLANLEITTDGKLIEWNVDWKNKKFISSFAAFTGVIRFYDIVKHTPHSEYWIEYSAKFFDGDLVTIERVLYEELKHRRSDDPV